MKNPFPGMNPYLEAHWPDVHARLIVYIIDQLQQKLPSGLRARAEEHITLEEQGQRSHLRPDVQINEPDRLHEPVRAYAEPNIAEPLIVLIEPETQRWIQIVDGGGRLITAIEVLSPGNKSLEGKVAYQHRQRAYVSGGVNLVEIDLLRGGEWVLSAPAHQTSGRSRAPYSVCVFRATSPGQREFYPLGLRQQMPAVRLPLRPNDNDAILALQPLVDQVFERGRYWMLDYSLPPQPALDAEDEAWADSLLRKSGLRSIS